MGETKAAELEETLQKWLPTSMSTWYDAYLQSLIFVVAAFEDPQVFTAAVEEDGSKGAFTPPGKLVSIYQKGPKEFEVWSGTLSDPAVKAVFKHLQFFVPLFIEAGSYIELNDPEWTLDRWHVFLL